VLAVQRSSVGIVLAAFCAWSGSAPALNAGLSPPTDPVERDTPIAAVQGFLQAAHAGRYELAAHYLWLNHVPKSDQTAEGARLARRLRFVIDRKLYLDFGREPAIDSSGRFAQLGTLPVGNANQPIRLIRVDLGGDRPPWVFSEDTVRAIDRLYERYGPPFGEVFPEFFFSHQLLAVELWQWLGLVCVLLGATLLASLLQRLGLAIGKRVVRLTRFKWAELLLQSAQGPLRLLLWAVLVVAATRFLLLPPADQLAVDTLCNSLAIISGAWFLLRLLAKGAVRVQELAANDVEDPARLRGLRTQLAVLQRVVASAIYVVSAALFLLQFEVVRSIGVSMLASAGIAGLVIGLAAQRPVSSLLGGIQLSITQPIRIGDTVVVEGETGTIEEIRLTYVVVKIWDLRRLVLPMSYFLDKPFQNWSKGSGQILGTVMLQVDYMADVESFRKELLRILGTDAAALWDGVTSTVAVTDASDRTITLRILLSAADPGKNFDLRCLVRERLLTFLRRHPEWLPRTRMQQ
jgi:small-conductance mechanosensitive channel